MSFVYDNMDDDIENLLVHYEFVISSLNSTEHRSPLKQPLLQANPQSPNRALQPLSLNQIASPVSRLNIVDKYNEALELEEFKCKRIKFDHFINLPKFREVFHQQSQLTFYCKYCHKSKTLTKPDKLKLINHICQKSHRQAVNCPVIDGLTAAQSNTRERIFRNFYFVFLNRDNRYYCGYCEDIFPVAFPYSHISEHEGTIRHLQCEKETFGCVFSRVTEMPSDFDYLQHGQFNDIVNHNKKVEESKEERLRIMKTVESELNIIYPDVFAIQERIIRFQNGEIKSKRFVCTKCQLQIHPKNYHYYLKRNSIDHLDSHRHKLAASGQKDPLFTEISNPIPSTLDISEEDNAAPRYCTIDLAAYAARIVLEHNYTFNSLQIENKVIMEALIGRVVTPKMVIRGLKELSKRIFDILQKKIVEQRVAIMIDETVKKSGRYIGFIVVTLDEPEGAKFYKMGIKHIPDGVKCDAEYINEYAFEMIDKIWQEGPRPGQIVSLISDAVSYMDCASNSMKTAPEMETMIHIKCLVHAVHRVAEELRSINPELAEFCSYFQQVYFNACSLNRTDELKVFILEHFGKYYKPPKFFYIRWTTWIKVCGFHKHYWVAIVFFIQGLVVPLKNGRPDSSSTIWKLKNLLLTKGPVVHRQLLFIFDSFSKLNESLRELESPRSLSSAVAIVQRLIDNIYSAYDKYKSDGEHVEEVIKSIDIYKKLIMVLMNNRDLPLAVARAKSDRAYENLPLTSAPIEDWFSEFRSLQSEYRPFASELTCIFVFCKTNITRYILYSQSKEKRSKPQNFGTNFDPKPKQSVTSIMSSMDFTDSSTDVNILLNSIDKRKHTKITEIPTTMKDAFKFKEIPNVKLDTSDPNISSIEISDSFSSVNYSFRNDFNLLPPPVQPSIVKSNDQFSSMATLVGESNECIELSNVNSDFDISPTNTDTTQIKDNLVVKASISALASPSTKGKAKKLSANSRTNSKKTIKDVFINKSVTILKSSRKRKQSQSPTRIVQRKSSRARTNIKTSDKSDYVYF